jgi:hypothetical protein
MGKGVVDGDAVDPVLDETGPDVQRELPTVDLDTLSMGMSDDFRGAVEAGGPSARQPRHLWASRLTTIGLTPPSPFVSVLNV